MYRTTYRHYDLSTRKKRNYTINQFYGVDLRPSQLNVDDYHATEINNMIYKDKVLQKRNGWEELVNFPVQNVNGYWRFKAEDGLEHSIVQIGHDLYEVSNLNNESTYDSITKTKINGNVQLADTKTSGFISKKRLYLLDGVKYRVLYKNAENWVLNSVEDDPNTYIPTTTIGISEMSSGLSTITALDDMNMITKWHYNKAYSVDTFTTTFEHPTVKFKLDALFDFSTYENVRDTVITINDVDYILCDLVLNGNALPRNVVITKSYEGSEALYKTELNVNYRNAYYNDFLLVRKIQDETLYKEYEEYEYDGYKYRRFKLNGTIIDGEYVINGDTHIDGYLSTYTKEYNEQYKRNETATLTLFTNPRNVNDAEDNILIKFPTLRADVTDKINHCTFGKVFNGNLFVSGNPDYKNTDWHTTTPSDANYGDLTYFSDLDYCNYGSDDTAVIGYDIYRDGDLIVFKEASTKEATLYRREYKLIQAMDYTGTTIDGQYEEGYPSYDINIGGGVGAINHHSIVNFMGDTIYLTRNGIKVLKTTQNTFNNEKIAYDVSTYINTELLKEDLTKVHLYQYGERLLVQTNSKLYVAEYNQINEDTKEYEWYIIDNTKARIFFQVEDRLYFGTAYGKIVRFKNNNDYIDQELYEVEDNGLSIIASENGKVTINSDYSQFFTSDMIEKIELKITSSNNPLHFSLGTFTNIGSGSFKIPFNETKIYDGLVVYVDGINSGAGLSVNTEYRVRVSTTLNTDNTYTCYLEKNNIRNPITFTAPTFRLSIKIDSNYVLRATDYEDGSFSLCSIDDWGTNDNSNVLHAINYHNVTALLSAVIKVNRVVPCFYMTKPYDMGTIIYSKNINMWSVANDTNLFSQMDIGYLTSRNQSNFNEVLTINGARQIDLSGFLFSEVSFYNDKLPHIYTKYRLLPNVSFLRFIFKNDTRTNAVLSKLSLEYTIGDTIKGVR